MNLQHDRICSGVVISCSPLTMLVTIRASFPLQTTIPHDVGQLAASETATKMVVDAVQFNVA